MPDSHDPVDRRTFIKLTAITGTSAALVGCGNPEHQVIRFIPDEEITPGIAHLKPSVCPLCQSGCGVIVRLMDADVDVVRDGQPGVVRRFVAKKLEGNPQHPISRGALCARGQAAIQVTYHPDRIRTPLKRSGPRGSGQFQEISWDEATSELVMRLDTLESAQKQKSLAILASAGNSVRHQLVRQFAEKFGAPPPVQFALFSDDVLRRANEWSFGRAQLPTFDLARARYVLSFGADFLGTWNSPVAQGFAYGEMRQGRPGIRGAFVQVEPRMTQTGASADRWVAIRPGTEGALALGLAHVIIGEKRRPVEGAGEAGRLIDGWSGGLQDFSPARVEQLTGVPAREIERLAREFADLQPAVAIIGGPPLAHTNALFSALAVNALNALVGNLGQPGGVFFTPQLDQRPAPSRPLQALASEILAASSMPVEVCLIDGVNPVFATPRTWKVREALERIPFIASFGSFIDETSALADLILPDHTFLESWTDSRPESGSSAAVLNVAGPVMKPLYQTRATPDVVLDVAKRLRRPLDLGAATFQEALQKSFAGLPGADEAWASAQKQGGWWGDLPKRPAPAAPRNARTPVAYASPTFDGDPQQYPFQFLPYASSAFLDGSLAHLPWLQEMPDPLTSAMWSSWIEINPRTAERLGVQQGDIVEVASQHGSLRSAAFVSPAIAPDVVAMPVGQGHEMFTRFASGRGENPISILAPLTESESGALAWAATRVRLTRASDADGRLIMFGGSLRENPHEGEIR